MTAPNLAGTGNQPCGEPFPESKARRGCECRLTLWHLRMRQRTASRLNRRGEPPAPEAREGATGQPDTTEDIVTVVINLGVLPDEEREDEPGLPPSTEPAATQPTAGQPAAASELPENP